MKKIIAFAWWWTWGHIFPIKSLIERLPKHNYKILWFGEKWKLEEKISKQLKDAGYDIVFLPILSGKIRRDKTLKAFSLNFLDIFKNLIGLWQSIYYILKYKPELIFSKWWYVAFTPSLAGKILWKKIYLHESDTVPGLVNKLVGKFANKIFLWFDEAIKYFDKNKVKVVGQILSPLIEKIKLPKETSSKTNLLIVWWSQWAKVLIQTIYNLLKKGYLQEFNIYVVGWLLNKDNIFKDFTNVNFYEFLPQEKLFELYALADLSITRGSATSLAEQDYFNIKKIIVPLPYTGWNHQYYNALAYEKNWDLVLSQLDQDFENKLLSFLNKFKGFKKKKKLNHLANKVEEIITFL